jgi:membrane protease YdiL (CAAX protease family)
MLDFLALATFLSWPLQILVYSGHAPAGTATLFLVLAGCGPSLAAVLLSRGRVLRGLRIAPPPRWLAVALVGPSVLVLLAALADAALGGPAPTLVAPQLAAVLLPALGEELGLRVYLYPRLVTARGRLGAALITGVAWAIWHVPSGLGPHPDAAATALFLAGLLVLAAPMAWIYERSGRSAWVALAAHAGVSAGLVRHGASWRATGLHLAAFVLVALVTGARLAQVGASSE